MVLGLSASLDIWLGWCAPLSIGIPGLAWPALGSDGTLLTYVSLGSITWESTLLMHVVTEWFEPSIS